MTNPTQAQAETEIIGSAGPAEAVTLPAAPELKGRSPGQIMWRRFLRDRTGVVCAAIVILFLLIAACAPLISALYGKNPTELYGQNTPGMLTDTGLPTGPNGGMSGEYWFGIEPQLGRDIFTQLIYGIRTSLLIAVVATVATTFLGILVGIIAGYAGGKTDYFIGRGIDILLSFPSQIFFIALVPVVDSLFVSPDESTPVWLRTVTVMIVLSALGWMGLARILRAVALSLREREFVEAARVTGASPMRIIFKELLPNLWTPILVQSTLALPGFVTAEAGLSYLGVGVTEPTPDWGRMIADAASFYREDITFLIFPGVAMVIFVLAFNLLGDSVRDAFDPKTKR
ncbi:ABC transporter permease [Peterkaempfera bronchialis]|uniref:ABC transporter permease n=1 Tax=Peterkaempfera bronchialis TaxID=2126346 RepID=A0A345SZX7_9ACTN|nr:ABC transporter permease [Peterkaempfera bronchialis]AXI79282.1 ABC transporter permease [Peterkaempfera bronchialis]